MVPGATARQTVLPLTDTPYWPEWAAASHVIPLPLLPLELPPLDDDGLPVPTGALAETVPVAAAAGPLTPAPLGIESVG